MKMTSDQLCLQYPKNSEPCWFYKFFNIIFSHQIMGLKSFQCSFHENHRGFPLFFQTLYTVQPFAVQVQAIQRIRMEADICKVGMTTHYKFTGPKVWS